MLNRTHFIPVSWYFYEIPLVGIIDHLCNKIFYILISCYFYFKHIKP